MNCPFYLLGRRMAPRPTKNWRNVFSSISFWVLFVLPARHLMFVRCGNFKKETAADPPKHVRKTCVKTHCCNCQNAPKYRQKWKTTDATAQWTNNGNETLSKCNSLDKIGFRLWKMRLERDQNKNTRARSHTHTQQLHSLNLSETTPLNAHNNSSGIPRWQPLLTHSQSHSPADENECCSALNVPSFLKMHCYFYK